MRLLIVSDTPAIRTGQARVVRELAARFHADGHEVTVGGWFHQLATQEPPVPYLILPVLKHVPESILPILDELRPEVVLAIGDPWDFAVLARARATGGPFKLVGHLNIEAGPLSPKLESVLDAFDVLTTSSAWGASILNRPAQPIHYGVDRSVFHPRPKPEAAFQRLYGRPAAETFLVLLNGQNIQRKNFPVALQGFARFAKGKDDVVCFANTEMAPAPDGPPGYDLADVVRQEGLQDLVSFNSGNRGPLNTVDDAAMAAIYSFADALLMTSHAEGFGLPLLEAMASHVVPIAPDAYSATELLWQGRGVLMPVGGTFRGNTDADMVVVHPQIVAQALEQVYVRWREGQLREMHQRGSAFAISRPWDRTYEQLAEAIHATSAPRVARGLPVDPALRIASRRVAAEHPRAIGVLKLGGLGDMLQTTVVVRAAAQKFGRPVVVWCNGHAEVFEAMPEVVDVKVISDAVQDEVVRSIADAFPIFLDVRYVSWAYRVEPVPFAVTHRWFYERWIDSCARLDDLSVVHATGLMLASLGLEAEAMELAGGLELSLQPVFTPRAGDRVIPSPYVAVATGVGSLGALKRWPEQEWERLVMMLEDGNGGGGEVRGLVAVQVGGVEDPPVPGAMDCRGLPLDRTASILEAAEGFVGVEGGMAHLAAAVGTRGVVIFGPTSPQLFGYPWNTNLSLGACTPCWWGPAWRDQRCTRGAVHCQNFVDAPTVYRAVSRTIQRVGRLRARGGRALLRTEPQPEAAPPVAVDA